jgi:hypothetical protein
VRIIATITKTPNDDIAIATVNNGDRHWVHNDFVRRLENEEGFKFCIHQRDFEAGETISGNVDHFLQNSWKVVVIISPLSSASLNPKKVYVVFNIDMTFQCENNCNNYQNTK